MDHEIPINHLRNSLDCNHSETKRAYRIYSNGTKHYGVFCLRCGHTIKHIKKKTLSQKDILAMPEFDETIRSNWREYRSNTWKRISALQQKKRDAESLEWWKKYTAYLNSEKWHRKSRKVLKRDNYICQACLKRGATQVHHLTYAHVYNEPLFDLVAICPPCHKYLHDKENQND